MEYLLLLQILITEVHPTPAAGEPEWVECVVTSTDALASDDYLICDNRTCVALPQRTVRSGTCIVLTRDAEALREVRSAIHDSVVVLECPLPSLNNTTDRVEIRRRDSTLCDALTYSIIPSERGRSVERHGIADNGYVRYLDAWSASVAFDSTTCGRINSHVQYERDVAITGVFVQDSVLHIGVVNQGRVRVDPKMLSIQIGALQFQGTCPNLLPAQWWSTQINLVDLRPTRWARCDTVTIQLLAADMRGENNVMHAPLMIPPIAGGVTITEILAEPLAQDCDFVEIWNGTSDTLDVTGWTLQDGGGELCRIVTPSKLPPNTYLACASDTSIVRMCQGAPWALVRPAMNVNAISDSVILRTSSGFVVDVAVYTHNLHSKALVATTGRSLEKRVPGAVAAGDGCWGSCTATYGSTPGLANSINQIVEQNNLLVTAGPSPFSTREGASRYPCVISWRQPFEQSTVRLVIVDLNGSYVCELLNGQFVGSRGSAIWDGISSVTKRSSPIGIYVAVFESVDAASGRVIRGTAPVVIGETP